MSKPRFLVGSGPAGAQDLGQITKTGYGSATSTGGADPLSIQIQESDADDSLIVLCVVLREGTRDVDPPYAEDEQDAAAADFELIDTDETVSGVVCEIWASEHLNPGSDITVYVPNANSASLFAAAVVFAGTSPELVDQDTLASDSSDPAITVTGQAGAVAVAVLGADDETFAADYTVVSPGVQFGVAETDGGGAQYKTIGAEDATLSWTGDTVDDWAIVAAAWAPAAAESGDSALLVFYPPTLSQPTSATVSLQYPGGTELQASTAATVDTVSTTISSAAAVGSSSVVVTSATGIKAGRRYIFTESGRRWVAEVEQISGTTVYLKSPIPFAFTTSTTVKGYALTYQLTTTHTADADHDYVATWVAVVDGAEHEWDQLFDIVDAADWHATTMEDVLAEYSYLREILTSDQLEGTALLDNAWDKHVVPMLRSVGKRAAQVKDKQVLVPLHCSLVNWVVAKNRAMIDETSRGQEADRCWADVERQWSRLIADLGWYDEDEDGQQDAGEEKQAIRGVRLRR